MFERKYDPTQPYRIVKYGRMSDPTQNKRSPDQQFTAIAETMLRCNFPWQCVETYRDDGISGRLVRKRPGLQRLLRDIETELITVDLLALDTYERLGRAEEIGFLRHKLFTEHGILVVAADNNFTDPTGIVGKAVGMVEQIRATENTRISRHNIIRGKKDCARLKRWPGGPRPFAFKFEAVMEESVSPPQVYSVLEPEPREATAMQLAFQRAVETGEGASRLAKWWNSSTDIPDDFKPVSVFTMGYRLSSRLYVGELVWGANRTAIVNDTRVVESNPDGAEIITDFCPALVSRELFDQVQQLREARSRQLMASRAKKSAGEAAKLIAPLSRGLTLKYLLTGLARCGCCNASMRPVPSGPRSKGGRRLVYYSCPRHYEGACANHRHVREEQLREAVVARVRARLFPAPGSTGEGPAWFPELMALVQAELQRSCEDEPDHAGVIAQESQTLAKQLAGWSMTLGDPDLPPGVRSDLVARYEAARNRKQELDQRLAGLAAMRNHVERTLDPGVVIDQLQRLGDVLAAYNPTLANLELSRHIERVACFPDDRVTMRGTYLGVFEGAVELLGQSDVVRSVSGESTTSNGFEPIVPRRRGRMRIPNLSAESNEALGGVDTVLDPERFAGLPPNFFWTESFVLTEKLSWAEANATEVVRLRASRLTIEKLAEHFGKTPQTIRKALRIGAAALPDQELPRKISHGRWTEQHAAEVMKLKQQGMGTNELAEHFRKSDTTIRAALKYAEEIAAAQRQPTCSDDAPDDSGAR